MVLVQQRVCSAAVANAPKPTCGNWCGTQRRVSLAPKKTGRRQDSGILGFVAVFWIWGGFFVWIVSPSSKADRARKPEETPRCPPASFASANTAKHSPAEEVRCRDASGRPSADNQGQRVNNRREHGLPLFRCLFLAFSPSQGFRPSWRARGRPDARERPRRASRRVCPGARTRRTALRPRATGQAGPAVPRPKASGWLPQSPRLWPTPNAGSDLRNCATIVYRI